MTNKKSPVIAGLVLAAGRARRMGRDKRMIVIDGRTLLDRAIGAALGGGLDPVLVVTGPDGPAPPAGVGHVVNPDPGRGMGSSLAIGVAALPDRVAVVVVLLADMPKIGPAHVARLCRAFAPGRICVPLFAGRRGNPVLLPRDLFDDLRALTGDQGARRLIETQSGRVVVVAMDDDSVLVDLDTPEDLAGLAG
jgi:molybdenum cofactor cytidylyltransferase